MTLSEAGQSTDAISFGALMKGEPVRASDSKVSVQRIADLIARGGWPDHLAAPIQRAQRLLRGYVAEIARTDLQRVDGVRRDPAMVARLLRSLARKVATRASINSLRDDVNGKDGNMKADTTSGYLDALSRLMVIEDLPAWRPSLRSRTRMRVAAVRHFVDPSLAVAAMNATPERLLRELGWLGLLFENLVVRDVRVHAQAIDAQLFAYRDETGLEADAVVEMPDGQWAAIEVKLGQGEVDVAAEHLLRLRDRVDTGVAGEPSALVVVTATGYGYVRKDGVRVVPIGALTL